MYPLSSQAASGGSRALPVPPAGSVPAPPPPLSRSMNGMNSMVGSTWMSAPPGHHQGAPPIISPRPQHAPTQVPTQQLQSQASEIAAVAPTHLNNSLQSSRPATTTPALTASLSPNMALDYNRRQSSMQPPQAQSGFLPAPTPSRHSMLPQNMPVLPPRPHSAGPGTTNSLRQSASSNLSASRGPPNSSKSLARPMPSIEDLASMRNLAQDAQSKVSWAKNIFKFLERNQTGTTIADPNLVQWVDEAVRIVLQFAGSMPPVPEALYLKADLTMSGTFPTILPKNPKAAFRDFESAANAEFAPAWYRIGREYEAFEDLSRAKDAYEKGCALGDVTSTYRLGMANLMAQLGVKLDVAQGIEKLKTAALIADQLADIELAAPLYVWAMILAGEFEAANVPPDSLPRDANESGKYMKKAAYLCHTTAQFKMGWAYEHAQLGYLFDPFMSVQYYSLASQQGDAEADMALSKWFLCGAEKCFSANEDLAWTFADKAARKGLATAEFALGYYSELGIGCPKDIETARTWYEKAASKGNEDAANRISTLQAEGQGMSREEHETHAAKLNRTRTQAKMRSDSVKRPASGGDNSNSGSSSLSGSTSGPRQGGMDAQRRTTMKRAQAAAQGQPYAPSPNPSMYGPPQHAPSAPASLAPPRAGPDMKRFTLTDAPASVSSPGSMPERQSSVPPSSRPSTKPVQVKPQKPGPETFEAMGIQTTTMKKDECIIC